MPLAFSDRDFNHWSAGCVVGSSPSIPSNRTEFVVVSSVSMFGGITSEYLEEFIFSRRCLLFVFDSSIWEIRKKVSEIEWFVI